MTPLTATSSSISSTTKTKSNIRRDSAGYSTNQWHVHNDVNNDGSSHVININDGNDDSVDNIDDKSEYDSEVNEHHEADYGHANSATVIVHDDVATTKTPFAFPKINKSKKREVRLMFGVEQSLLSDNLQGRKISGNKPIGSR